MRIFPSPQWKDTGASKEVVDGEPALVTRLEVDDTSTYVDKDGSDNMTFTDAVTGTKTLAQLAAGGAGGVDTSGTPVDNDYAKFTDADTIEGRSYSEVKADLDLEIGTDVLAQQTIGIADNNLVEIDDADAAATDYAKFTATGLQGRDSTEVKTDLSLNLVENTAHSTDAHTMTIDGRDVSADGTKLDGIESSATADQTGAEMVTLLEALSPGSQLSHDQLDDVSANDHHTQSHDHSGAGDGQTLTPATLNIPTSATPAQTADGQAVWDSDGDFLTIGDGASRKSLMNVGDAPTAHKDTHDPDGTDPLDCAAAAEISVVVAASEGTGSTLARSDHVHAINHAITDNHLVTIDGTTNAPVNTDYAKFTANGLEGMAKAQILSDLNVTDGADVTGSNTCDTPGGAGTDTTAIHDNTANEITAITLKGTPAAADEVVLEDSAASYVKKSATISTIGSGIKIDDLATPDDNTDLDFSTTVHGLVPKGTNIGNFLKDDGTWSAPAGGGDVTGPGASVDNAIVRFNSTSGKVIQDYTSNAPTISDTGDVTIDGDLSADNTTVGTYKVFDAGGETITGDGTDMTINSGNDINLTATTDINVPANVGVTFGNDGEKIEGNGTDLTIASSNLLNLSATTDVVIPVNVGLHLGDGAEKLESDNTNLTINSGGELRLTPTSDVVLPVNIGLHLGDGTSKLESNDTDLTINAGGDINLTAVGDINVPANVGVTFGDDGEKIEGNATDLTISGNNINLTAVADVVVPANVGVTFGTGEKIEGNNTDLTITSGGDIALTATGDVNLPASVGLTLGNDGEKIEGDGTDLTIASSNILNISASGNMLFAENTGLEWDNALSADGKYSGIVTKQFNGGATIPFGEVVYLKAADSEWYQAKADVTATSGAVMVGICVLATTDAGACTVLLSGKVRADAKFPTFTISAPVFISAATAGLLTSTAPTGTTNFVVRIIGHAGTGDELYVHPDNSYVELA